MIRRKCHSKQSCKLSETKGNRIQLSPRNKYFVAFDFWRTEFVPLSKARSHYFLLQEIVRVFNNVVATVETCTHISFMFMRIRNYQRYRDVEDNFILKGMRKIIILLHKMILQFVHQLKLFSVTRGRLFPSLLLLSCNLFTSKE